MKNFLNLFFLISLCSCSAKISDFAKFESQPILKSNYISKEDIKKGKPSVVVLNFNNRENNIAKNANLGNAIATSIENILTESDLINLKDRKAFKQLSKEIEIAELSGTGSYQGPTSVDYAISGDIADAGYEHKFIAASSSYNAATKTYSHTPARHKYTATFEGNIKIYKVPSLDVEQVVAVKGKEVRLENAVVKRTGFFKKEIDMSAAKIIDENLIRKAALDAIDREKHQIKNIFASFRKAYILARKSDGSKNIFQINLGKGGVEYGQKVKIFSKRKSTNPITEEEYIEEIELGEGVVTNIINNKTAWILVKDDTTASQIKIGDWATIIFKESLSRKLKTFSKTIQ